MKGRWLASGVVVGLVIMLTLGFAYKGSASVTGSFAQLEPGLRQAMEAMHESPAMEAMHGRMPESLQQQCDALHDRMLASGSEMMGSEMMTGGSGGMMASGSGMMGS